MSRLTIAVLLGFTALTTPAAAQTPTPAATPAPTPSTATQTVDTMNKLWGRHPGQRANHAEGVVVAGSFVATPEAAKLSKAVLFSGVTVPMVVRFSNATGLVNLADGTEAANPHGMAMRFRPEGAPPVDVGLLSLPFFPVATGEEFAELLQAASESGPDAPKPSKIEQFVAAHPLVAKATATVQTPTSFARETFNGINAFIFVNAAGERHPFRYQFQPVAGAEHLDTDAAAKMAPDFLRTELPERLAKGPVQFRVVAQLANPGDTTKDPTQAWPSDRRMVDMGMITLTQPVADQESAARDLRLLPSQLEPGIEVSDDPIIAARVRAYVLSFGRRAR